MKRDNFLGLAEHCSVGGVFLGLICTVTTKQLIYSISPLAFYFLFNTARMKKYHEQSTLSIKQSQKIDEIYQDLMTFNNDYKYQKLEIEELLRKTKAEQLELNKTLVECINKNQNKHIEEQLLSLQSLNANLLQKTQSKLESIEKRIEEVEKINLKSDKISQYSIGNASELKGLSHHYALKGLTQKLILEIKSSNDINYFKKIEENSIVSEHIFQYIHQTVKHAQYLSEVVTTYYRDHNCSYQEAEELGADLNQLAMEISMIRTTYDLRFMYKVVALYTYQISRFKHKKIKYRWNHSMREKMLNILSDCLSQI